MAKIKKQWISAVAPDKTKFAAEVEVLIDSEGVFSIGVPEELWKTAPGMLEVLIDARHSDTIKWASKVSTSYWRDKLRVYSKEMDAGLRFLSACAKDYISGVETTERVIAYTSDIKASFWYDNGRFAQNGCGQPGGQWWKPTLRQCQNLGQNNSTVPAYTVGLGAQVYDKITTTRTSGKTERYILVSNPDNHHGIETDPAYRLNRFSLVLVDPRSSYTQFMPYTPEAATFFYETMMTICKMAMAVDNFLGDKDKLLKAIECHSTGGGFLLQH